MTDEELGKIAYDAVISGDHTPDVYAWDADPYMRARYTAAAAAVANAVRRECAQLCEKRADDVRFQYPLNTEVRRAEAMTCGMLIRATIPEGK
jgi:hypothetical protein